MKIAKVETLSMRIKSRVQAQKIAHQQAEEQKLWTICRKTAKSALPGFVDVSVYNTNRTKLYTIKPEISEYLTKMEYSSGDLAPWDKIFRKSK